MLRCKESYTEICPIDAVKLVGNSLVAWPASLKNCRRVPHPQREAKPFLRDRILCRESGGHVGNVQNNLAIGEYKGKLVALFRANETVLDCGQGTMIDFPSWQALREMLATKVTEVALSAKTLLRLAGEAEEEVAAGLAEEVVKAELPDSTEAELPPKAPARQQSRKASAPPAAKAQKKAKIEPKAEPTGVRLEHWLSGEELGDYPNAIRLVSSENSESFAQLEEEAAAATFVAYDVQWSPDFDEGTDNKIALVQLAFPTSGNTYVLQLPLLGFEFPECVRALFESPSTLTIGFAANEIDSNKLRTSGVEVDVSTLLDVQPWCEAEMGENKNVLMGWRVGLKRASSCVLDFEMDKTSTVASSNWEREELTSAQVEYAAMDVWVALRLFQKLAQVYGQN
eukprot:TRINITY_DN67677_c0_g1_i1.p1 TRINITY_DN67677_c0_g1~~TRINITY_DN67677_c0_g1_i1.p1  ORF type:complete len:398 (-),score=87.33 TRINITY_DN67677_c0_g1_i1:110-1303(-)